MVASEEVRAQLREKLVLIPFIAGQWSLHAGAANAVPTRRRVLIPFIAGQWSLPTTNSMFLSLLARVLIPFIAGQWSLLDEKTLVGALRKALS